MRVYRGDSRVNEVPSSNLPHGIDVRNHARRFPSSDPSTARICNWLPKPGTGAGASAPRGLLRRPERITPATLARKSIDENASPSVRWPAPAIGKVTGFTRYIVEDGTKERRAANASSKHEITDVMLQQGRGAEVAARRARMPLPVDVEHGGGPAREGVADSVRSLPKQGSSSSVDEAPASGDGWSDGSRFLRGGRETSRHTARGSGKKHNGQECSGHEHPPVGWVPQDGRRQL